MYKIQSFLGNFAIYCENGWTGYSLAGQKHNKKQSIVRILLRYVNLQFRPLQNSEHLHMHYTGGRFANYGNEGTAYRFF